MGNTTRESLKGYSIKTKTDTGMCAKLTVWVFAKCEIRIEQKLLVEIDYTLSTGESILRETKNYKLIVRFLMLTSESALHLLQMTSGLIQFMEEENK